jgi:hypothetical protein
MWLKNYEHFAREPKMTGKANIARYEILLKYGGIYLDCDFAVHRSMTSVFDAINIYGFVTARQSRTVYNNAFMGANAGHAVSELLVEGIPHTSDRFRSFGTVARTGPHYLTEILASHLREGGRFGEFPQHAVYPWSSSEAPLLEPDIPPSVIVSHEWATTGTDYWTGSSNSSNRDTAESRRKSYTQRLSLRARASRSPVAHGVIEQIESRLFRGGLSTHLISRPQFRNNRMVPSSSDSYHGGFEPMKTDVTMDAWSARLAARMLRGSDNFLDLWPLSSATYVAATRVLDRPGTAILVTSPTASAPPETTDSSVRCSTHVLITGVTNRDEVLRLTSHGASLYLREVSTCTPPLGLTASQVGESVSTTILSIPRIALVRATAEETSERVCSALGEMMRASRIGTMVIRVDPTSARPETARMVDLIGAQESLGRQVNIGPWIVDGRGRKWWQHLRIASRPFFIVVN